jgi:hypothetical protein
MPVYERTRNIVCNRAEQAGADFLVQLAYGDLNFCHRLGSTIFPFRRRPPSHSVVVSGWAERAGADFLILGLSFLSACQQLASSFVKRT